MPTILATWPNGEAISGIDFTIGFDSGEPVSGYTQYNGWTLPDDERRAPRWIEVSEPIYQISAPRFDLTKSDNGRLHVRLIPNDLGQIDLTGACVEARGDVVVMRRTEGELRFRRFEPEPQIEPGDDAE